MVTNRPPFPGDSEVDELFKVFRILGTPDDEVWPGVTALPDWNEAFPVWPTLNLEAFVPGCTKDGIHLINNFITLDPKKRMSAQEALRHPYFAEMHNAF